MYPRRVDFSDLVFSLSSHRHSFIGLVFNFGIPIDKQLLSTINKNVY